MADGEYKRLACAGPSCKAPGCGNKPKRRGLCKGHYKKALMLPLAARDCLQCGQQFAPLKVSHTSYCSRRCKTEHWRRRNPEKSAEQRERAALKPHPQTVCSVSFNECKACGKHWTARRRKAHCSRDCELESARRHALELAIQNDKRNRYPRPCRECGAQFVPAYGDLKRVFCGAQCLHAYGGRVGKAKRRARIRGVKCESIDPIAIFRRDGWTCQLCGGKTPRRLRGSIDPNAPELDHIIPLAAGGGHTQENVQCSCRACNSAKGARPLGQMLLTGFADSFPVD